MMKKSIKYQVSSIMGVLLLLLYLIPNTNPLIPSARAFDAMTTYRVTDSQAVSGDILSESATGLSRSDKPYDTHIFGVIVDDPLAVYRNRSDDSSFRPVATNNSDTVVNVTDYNGPISPGDPITSSPIPGKAMKALVGGFILGIATSTVTPGQPVTFQGKKYNTGQLKAVLRIGFYDPNESRSAQTIFSSIASAFLKNAQDPEKFAVVVRYLITGLISVLAFVVGLYAFTRSISKGIEAIGRNPLAKKAIQL